MDLYSTLAPTVLKLAKLKHKEEDEVFLGGTDVQSACGSYTWIDGNTYTISNNIVICHQGTINKLPLTELLKQ